jgi:hypothetical protein
MTSKEGNSTFYETIKFDPFAFNAGALLIAMMSSCGLRI